MKKGDRAVEEETAIGIAHRFEGPGMSRYLHLHFMQVMNEWASRCVADDGPVWSSPGEGVCQMLEAAFEAGRMNMAQDIRMLIGAQKAGLR